jgi:hypothetical protein
VPAAQIEEDRLNRYRLSRHGAIAVALGGITLATAAVAMPSLASAQAPEAPSAAPSAEARPKSPRERLERLRERARNAEVAVAFGRLAGDEAAVIDFRGAEGPARSGGHLRFWTEDDGFYNGVARKVEINGQVVHAEGAGPLTRPDGSRVRVRFTLDLDGATNRLTITVTGEGVDYTLAGTVEGRVFVGVPPTPAPATN